MSNSPAPFRPAGMLGVTSLFVALVAVLATRPLPEAAAAQVEPGPADAGSAQHPAPSARDDSEPAAQPAVATSDAVPDDRDAAEPEAEAEAEVEPPRPLRVVALGWELLAPVVLANDGLSPGEDTVPAAAKLDLHASVAHEVGELEVRLARGGATEDGADIAILPLPTFVASYERLRALDPQVFFVLGWSRGRDALAADDPDLLLGKPPRGQVRLVGMPGQSATLLGLFALDELGVDPDHIELVSPHDSVVEGRTRLRAIERASTTATASLGQGGGHLDTRDLILTSADAPRLVPIVAVAPGSYVRTHTSRLAGFGRTWLAGTERFAADAPAAARRVAVEPGAPEAVALLNAVAYLEFTELGEAARVAGLSGRDAISLEHLFHRNWDLWREVGVLSTPAPEHAPLDNSVLARVVLGEGAAALTEGTGARRSGDRLLLSRELDSADPEQLVETLGLLAGIFERGEIELRVRGDKRASQAIVAEAVERFGLDPEHVRVGPRLRGQGAAARIRVHVP